LGLSPSQFWNLTWYEWGFYSLKLHDTVKHDNDLRELFLGVARIMIADFRNVHREKGAPIVMPWHVFKLSYDKIEERPLTFKEAKALFGSRIKKDA
jgi:hypothetical protein